MEKIDEDNSSTITAHEFIYSIILSLLCDLQNKDQTQFAMKEVYDAAVELSRKSDSSFFSPPEQRDGVDEAQLEIERKAMQIESYLIFKFHEAKLPVGQSGTFVQF